VIKISRCLSSVTGSCFGEHVVKQGGWLDGELAGKQETRQVSGEAQSVRLVTTIGNTSSL
jgi:hypothetical protein